MEVTISKAHKMTGVARSTIYNDMDTGKLSYVTNARGKKMIMVSELQRVYGDIQLDTNETKKKKDKASENVASASKRSDTTKKATTDQVAVLQERIQSLQTSVSAKDEMIDDLKEQRRLSQKTHEEQVEQLNEVIAKAQDGYNKVTKLLEDKTGQGSGQEWKEALSLLEKRLANQEEEAKKKSAFEEELLSKQKELEEQLQKEKSKSFVHKLFGL